MLFHVYTINSRDTDTPAAWMDIASTITPGARDSGRCRFRAEVSAEHADAFETELDEDADVLDWQYCDEAEDC